MAEHRFFIQPGELPATQGSPAMVVLRGPEHHHLGRVLRLRPGAQVALFDGEGRGCEGVLESVSKDESRIRLSTPDSRNVEPAFHLTLAQGIPAHDRMDLIIQKTTELGVWAIQPIVADRTTARIGEHAGWKRLDRWQRIAREAARQSGRLRVPAVSAPLSWDAYHAGLPAQDEGPRFMLRPDAPASAHGESRGHEAPGLAPGSRGGIVAVGPEGGWTEREEAVARRAGFGRLGLGPRTLRTETAGIVAVAVVLFLAGELGGRTEKPSLP